MSLNTAACIFKVSCSKELFIRCNVLANLTNSPLHFGFWQVGESAGTARAKMILSRKWVVNEGLALSGFLDTAALEALLQIHLNNLFYLKAVGFLVFLRKLWWGLLQDWVPYL